jgi:hypothetical protein
MFSPSWSEHIVSPICAVYRNGSLRSQPGKILELPKVDYRYRLVISKGCWTTIVSELAEEQEWSTRCMGCDEAIAARRESAKPIRIIACGVRQQRPPSGQLGASEEQQFKTKRRFNGSCRASSQLRTGTSVQSMALYVTGGSDYEFDYMSQTPI